MSTYQDSSGARRKLRTELRAARKAKGLTQQQVASTLEWSLSKLLRIEAGSVGTSVTDVQALISLYGISDPLLIGELRVAARISKQPPWWHPFKDIVRPQFEQLLGYETFANVFLEFVQVLIPGPFQIKEYATAVMRAAQADEPERSELALSLELRLERGRRLLGRDDVSEIVIVLDEFGLLRSIGGRKTMRDQLHYLLRLADSKKITLEVVPLSAGEHTSLGGSFKILQFDDDESDVLYTSGLSHDALIRDEEKQINEYRRRMDQIRQHAITGDKCLSVIANAADRFAAEAS